MTNCWGGYIFPVKSCRSHALTQQDIMNRRDTYPHKHTIVIQYACIRVISIHTLHNLCYFNIAHVYMSKDNVAWTYEIQAHRNTGTEALEILD